MLQTIEDATEGYKWAQSLYEWLMANKNNVKFDYVEGNEYTVDNQRFNF